MSVQSNTRNRVYVRSFRFTAFAASQTAKIFNELLLVDVCSMEKRDSADEALRAR